MSHKRIFSLESDNLATDAGELEPVAVADSLRVEDDIAADAGDIQGDTVAIEEAVDAAGRLEDTADVLQDAVDNGQGLDESAARMTEVAVEAIMARIGYVGAGKKIVPSVESFGGSNTRVHSTRASLEGVMDTVKEVWKKVKDWLKALWVKITDFFGKFFDNTEKVKKAVESTRERVNELSGKTPKEKEIDCKALADGFSIKGKFEPKNIAEVFANHAALTSASNNVTKALEYGVGMLNKMVVNKNPSPEDAINFGVEMSKTMSSLSLASKPGIKTKEKKDGSEVATISHGPYFGGRFIKLVISENKDGAVTGCRMEVTESEAAKSSKIPVMSQQGMNDALDGIETLNKETEKFKNNQAFFRKLQSEVDQIIASAFRIMDAVGDRAESANNLKKTLSIAKSGLSDMSAISARYVTMTPSWNVAICNKVITGINDCIKAYKK